MKYIILKIALLTSFTFDLMAVPAAPYLITFAQPDGSTFEAHLRGDEHLNWIEAENKMIIIKNKTSGYFEFAMLKLDDKNRLKLVPSGIAVIKRGQSSLRYNTILPDISREQLEKIWRSRIAEKRKIKMVPAKNSP
tara:strand:+ start:136 stop:543 length:408 start_codon:yes stop_codon:yes gene_type:complete